MTSIQKWNKNTALVLHNNKLTIQGCLDAPHISYLVSEFGFKEVALRIKKELEKINTLYGYNVNENYYILFVDMIIDTYKFESMDDVVMCLTDGRNGKYGRPFKQLDPATFQFDWMSKHLEKKAIAREKAHNANKKDSTFEGWKTREEYEKAAKKPITKSTSDVLREKNTEYQKFKAEYEGKKIKK